ncbi:MAG: ParA family protein [Chloroflexota bacterium]
MSRNIAIANQKGGVGKTTTTVNLAAGLAKFGNRVAIIDLDSQGALTISMGFDPYTIKPSTYDLLLNPKTTLHEVLQYSTLNLQIAPANAELSSAEYRLYKEKNRINRLRTALEIGDGFFDFILIDTPPSMGIVTVNALVAATELLIPVSADYLSMRGIRSLLNMVWLIRKQISPQFKLLGVLPTMVHDNAPGANAAIKEMRSVFKNKVFKTMIPYDDIAATAPARRKTILDTAPESNIAQAYMQLAKEVSNAKA